MGTPETLSGPRDEFCDVQVNPLSVCPSVCLTVCRTPGATRSSLPRGLPGAAPILKGLCVGPLTLGPQHCCAGWDIPGWVCILR